MITKRTLGILALVAAAVALLAAACGGDTEPSQPARTATAVPTVESVQPTQTPAPQVLAEPTEEPDAPVVEPTAEVAVADPTVELEPSAVAVPTFTWEVEDIDVGIKPAIALTSDGLPHVAYMTESGMGYVRAAVKQGGEWQITPISEGYFYGPLDLTIGPDDVAHVVYHDHQALEFQPDKGDAVYAVLRDGVWSVEAAADAGHDGWDTRITTDGDGNPHVSALDPKGFDGNGIEYYSRDAEGKWAVEDVGSGPIDYTFSTSIAIDPDGNPHISYYDTETKDLVLASRDASGWSRESVETEGDTGLFSYLVIDGEGRYHLSYFEKTSDTTGTVKYATKGPSDTRWDVSVVDTLDDVTFGFNGARNVVSLALDSSGRPWIALGDRKLVKLAIWDGSAWQIQTAADAGFRLFGQLVSLALDADDNPHIAFFQVTTQQPLEGRTKYVSGTPG